MTELESNQEKGSKTMKQYLSKQNLPMLLLVAMIVWAWLSLVSVLIASLL